MKHLILPVILAALTGCCSHPAAVVALDRGIATMKGNLADVSMTPREHEISRDSSDVFYEVKFGIDAIDKLPADVQARREARAAAAKAAEEAKAVDVGGGQ